MRKLGILIAVVFFGIFVFAEGVDIEALSNRLDLLEEYTNMIYDTLNTKLSAEDLDLALAEINDKLLELDALTNRIDLLEEYTNMIYDTLGTKVSAEELEMMLAEFDSRLSELETQLLNVSSTVETGLPALRDMLYELSANLAAMEDRITSYVEVSLASIKEEMFEELQPMFDDIKVTLDIHDSDILKIYDTLGMLSEQIAAIEEKLAGLEEANIESLALRLDMHDQDIVNIYDNLSAKADREQVDALEEKVATLEEDLAGLSDVVTGLAAQIGDTDYLLRKSIENVQKDLQGQIDTTNKNVEGLKASIEELKANKADTKAVEEKVNMLNIIAWLGLIIGVAGLFLPIQ
ncbi:hypothetical protein MNL76_08610 [Fervidobacterium riparium]|uniref:hypothetical protein n=1 Tax=Fervidobacterium gondwanense TaxID=44754 RepID=UPI0022085D3F|nr:hypothetical protein IB67_00835 [Fervidobacterium riparium]